MTKLPFWGPTRLWGKVAFFEVSREDWPIYLAERERADNRLNIGLLIFAAVLLGVIWWLNRA